MIWWILSALLILIVLVLFLISGKLFRVFVGRPKNITPIEERTNLTPLWQDAAKRMGESKQWIKTLDGVEDVYIDSFDSLKLHGSYIPAQSPSNRFILAIHGYTSTGLDEFAAYVPFYRDMGFNMLIIDCRAHGKSDGKYITFGYYDRYDCTQWCRYIVDRFGEDARIALHGISMGAATAIMTASEKPANLLGVIADCGYTSIWDEFHYVIKRNIGVTPKISIWLSGVIHRLRSGFWLQDCSPLESIKSVECPFLFIHGANDNFVPTYMVDELYEACPSDKEKLIVEDAPHAASFWVNTAIVSETIIAFLKKLSLL